MTDPNTPPNMPAPPSTVPPNDADLTMVKVPLLVSGILNALGAASMIVTGIILIVAIVGCFILPFAAAVGVLAFFEIKTFLDLNQRGYDLSMRGKIQLLAILEICTIVFGNVPSMVCGILVIVTLPKLDEHPA